MLHHKLSIVLATYNGERFLREQLDSLYSQTLLPDEVIVVDDCSTDGTVNILQEYKDKYGLKYIVNEHNLGVNANFEKGIKLSTGDYISLCDQDDVWFKNKNEILYNKLSQLEIKYGSSFPCCVSSRNTFVDVNLNIHHTTELKHDTDDYRDTIIHHLSQGSSMMFNRSCKKFIFPIPTSEICYDTYIGYVIAMVGHKYDLSQSLMYYRVHGNNVTATLENAQHQFKLRRKRPTSVVPSHMIKTYMKAASIVEKNTSKDKVEYVRRIIKLSQDINLFQRIYILLITRNIPFMKKVYSVKAAILNSFLAQ